MTEPHLFKDYVSVSEQREERHIYTGLVLEKEKVFSLTCIVVCVCVRVFKFKMHE